MHNFSNASAPCPCGAAAHEAHRSYKYTRITKPEAGMITSEITWYVHGQRNELEVLNKDVEAALADVFSGSLVEEAQVVTWVHRNNNYGCLPAVVANSCSLTTYKRINGEIVTKPVNIFG